MASLTPSILQRILTISMLLTLIAASGCVVPVDPPQSSSVASSSSVAAVSSARQSSSSSVNSVVYPPIQNGCNGYATRFWDCCKPHCGWSGNMPMGVKPNNSCGRANNPLSDINAQSACNNGDAHTCYGLIPFAMNDNVAYGWAATQSGDICGRCYQLDFTGQSFNAGNDPGSAALKGKTMVVQAINIGGDVGNSQFDILIPGGGVGIFNACSAQWGVSTNELGAQYGGFLAACKQQLGYDKSLNEYKSCVKTRCDNVFGSRGLTELHRGCLFFVDWFQAADNPSLKYKEVRCPDELVQRSGMDRRFLNDVNQRCGN